MAKWGGLVYQTSKPGQMKWLLAQIVLQKKEEEEDWQLWEEGSSRRRKEEVWVCQLPEPGPAPSGRLEKGCGARKQTTSTPSVKLGKAACSCPLTALSVSQSFCPVYSPPHQPLKVNVWASKRSCPPKCAPATALRRPRHAPLPYSLHTAQNTAL